MVRAPVRSAGLLLWRRGPTHHEVLLAHMGGPFWANKDIGSWTIPKGEIDPDEDPFVAAHREFTEEIGSPPPSAEPYPLGEVRQRNGKIVLAWAVEGDLDVSTVVSNTFEMEWPPRSGRRQSFPEIDRAAWFDLSTAGMKVIQAQSAFLGRLPWVQDS